MLVRSATPSDSEAIAAIYGHHVLHGTPLRLPPARAPSAAPPPPGTEMAKRLDRVVSRGWPWLVAEQDGTVIGYAYAAQFRDRAAYRFSAENSVYVHPDHTGRGIGRQLLEALLAEAAAAGFQRMFAAIGDSANVGSVALHEHAGFEQCGRLGRAGFKFGRYLDVVFMQRDI